jgi:DHA1 family multidrug resistance protein-like MFS transporter
MMMVLGLVSALGQGLLAGPLIKKMGRRYAHQSGHAGNRHRLRLHAVGRYLCDHPAGYRLLRTDGCPVNPGTYLAHFATGHRPAGHCHGTEQFLRQLGRIVGPLVGGFLFDLNILFPYLSSVAIMIIGFIASLIVFKEESREYQIQNKYL